jgi:hypothetical protein
MEKKVAATKKNPKQNTHLGFGSLLPQNQASFAGRRVSGDGVPLGSGLSNQKLAVQYLRIMPHAE